MNHQPTQTQDWYLYVVFFTDAVTNLSEEKDSRTSSSLRIKWTTRTGDYQYRVQRTDSSNPGDSGTVWSNGGLQSYNSQSVGELSSNVESLNANTKYYIRIITCYNGNNCERTNDGTPSRHFGPFKTRCSGNIRLVELCSRPFNAHLLYRYNSI